VSIALQGSGHEVFFDKASLQPGGDYRRRLREAIDESELFFFLISPESVAPDSFARTEMAIASKKWKPTAQDRLATVGAFERAKDRSWYGPARWPGCWLGSRPASRLAMLRLGPRSCAASCLGTPSCSFGASSLWREVVRSASLDAFHQARHQHYPRLLDSS